MPTGRRVLVVDDEPGVCAYATRILGAEGFEVVTTTDPRAAIQMLRDDREFDLLITDYRMPNVDGITLALKARQLRPHLPVLLITGFGVPDVDLNNDPWISALLTHCLPKPFRIDDLATAVRALLPNPSGQTAGGSPAS